MDTYENQNSNEVNQIDLLEILQIFLKRWWIILLAAVFCAGIMFVYTKFSVTPMYSATASIWVVPNRSGENDNLNQTDLTISANLINDYHEMVRGRRVINAAIEKLGMNISYNELLTSMTVSTPTNSRWIYITVQNPDPVVARDLANAVSDESQAAIQELMKTEISPGDDALTPTTPSTPLKRNVAVGAVGGAAVVCIVLVILYMFNDKVNSPADVTRYLGMTTLGVIPVGKTDVKKRRI